MTNKMLFSYLVDLENLIRPDFKDYLLVVVEMPLHRQHGTDKGKDSNDFWDQTLSTTFFTFAFFVKGKMTRK